MQSAVHPAARRARENRSNEILRRIHLEFIKKGLFMAIVTAMTLSLLLSPAAAAETKTDDKVAVVNGVVISKADFEKELFRVQQQLAASGRDPRTATTPEVQNEILSNMIKGELLHQAAGKKGIKIDENMVAERWDGLKKRFATEEEFAKALNDMQITEAELKAQIQRGMVIETLINQEFFDKTTVTDQDAQGFYDGNPDKFSQPEKVRASHILITVEPQADEAKKAEARKQIEAVQARLSKGEDFAALAKEVSKCPSAAKGGDLGFFPRGQMVPAFDEAAFALKVGEVSGVVETQFGYHLIKLAERQPASTVPFADVKDRLIQYLRQQKVREQVGAYVAGLEKDAKIERFQPVEEKKN